MDIASRRGMLLTKLVETVKEPIHLISTDLSFDIRENIENKMDLLQNQRMKY